MVAAAVIGSAVAGAAVSANASSKAADAQENAAKRSSDTQLQMYDQTRADQTPWRTAGGQAVNALSQYYGLGGLNGSQPLSYTDWSAQQGGGFSIGPHGDLVQKLSGGTSQADYQKYVAGFKQQNGAPDFQSILQNLPGYQFQRNQGNLAVQRDLAAKGLLNSGAAGKALQQYGQGLAGSYAQQYTGGLQSLAGLGQSSVQATGAAGANAANQISSNQIYSGNAQANGTINTGNAWANALSQIGGGFAGMYGGGGGAGLISGGYSAPYGINSGFGTTGLV
jgi:hypothetical protein